MILGSDILFTTAHVITDWPISDHMKIVHNGWCSFMPSIVYCCVDLCDWSQWTHSTDRANDSSYVPCD
ncbi:unnamed protein product [Staurois parvus]|uniref:Uncharacterized protein n=1 Tax=Staurois parvus TaxID=386267 RepID=A0ABN9D241_9NEOB|nr:unnamed protein product [Staurois parvus]